MGQDLMHPLISSSFTNLVGLVLVYGCERRFVPRLLYRMLMTLARSPVMWMASAVYARRTRRDPEAGTCDGK